MARDPNKPKKARSGLKEVKPRQRMIYINTRIAELNSELDRLKTERASLRDKIGAGRGGRKAEAGKEE